MVTEGQSSGGPGNSNSVSSQKGHDLAAGSPTAGGQNQIDIAWIFPYPIVVPVRKHGPTGYANYQYFKPWLRDEFVFRCVYCLEREVWASDRENSFGADHLDPKKNNPAGEKAYLNLAYCCNRCNSWKKAVRVIDPTTHALGLHLLLGTDGKLIGATDEGKILIKQLHLNENPSLENRIEAIQLYNLYLEMDGHPLVQELYLRHFGYPENLPNLEALNPPGGNTIPNSELSSHYHSNHNKTLPIIY